MRGAAGVDCSVLPRRFVSGTSIKYNYLLPAHSVFNARLAYDNT